MLNLINKIYLFTAIFLYFLLSPKISEEYLLIHGFTIFTFISYFSLLYINSSMNQELYRAKYLNIEVFFYALFFILFQNIISYFYTQNFFMFSFSDAYFYHYQTLQMLDMSFGEGIQYYLSFMDVDDLGIILLLYPLYHISESNLMLNFVYLFIAVISASSLFQLSENFMSTKYAFLASLSYSLSSFVLFFHTTGLKETLMIMFVILSFNFYYRFIKSKNSLYLINALLFMGMLFLFRPAIVMMMIGGIILGSVFSREGGLLIKIASFLIIIFLIAIGDTIFVEVDKYTTGGVDTLIEARESQGMVIGGVTFTYVVNILSQSIGPIPTLVTSEKISTMFYAPGLIYRILLALPFWLGVIYIYKSKNNLLYPLVLFVILEMSALVFLMDGLELRKAIPHIPFVFIIAFWFLDKYDNQVIEIEGTRRFQYFFRVSIFFLILIIFYWNIR